ncbi:MAG: tyrosine-type recombinase/integrase, partial [Pseudomonadota bacterium]
TSSLFCFSLREGSKIDSFSFNFPSHRIIPLIISDYQRTSSYFVTAPKLRNQFIKSVGNVSDQGKPVTFHRLRHTFATSLLSAGVSIVSIMKLLGHRKIEMSLRYAKITPSHLRNEYLNAIDSLEKKWTPNRSLLPVENSQSVKPASLISQLKSFVDKAAIMDYHHKKTLLRRLSRLHKTLASISFSLKFIPHL